MKDKCELVNQGFRTGKCLIKKDEKKTRACEITLKFDGPTPLRLIKSAHLSRPEHYFSIYQSGCNLACKKCHSWTFSQLPDGEWLSPDDILKISEDYAETVTVFEPRKKATSYHATDLCRGCGTCVGLSLADLLKLNLNKEKFSLKATGKKGKLCPGKVKPSEIILSPQGYGPARNIIGFTGGDLGCRTEFYTACAIKIKEKIPSMWILFETNGYGLTPKNLDNLQTAGIDSFWLDIKAFDNDVHKKLTGCSNERILKLPEEMTKRNFTLEVLSLFIPGWVETDQLKKIASIIADISKEIPFCILAFFPQFKMNDVRKPTLDEMLEAYMAAKEAGLENVRLGNLGMFLKSDDDFTTLLEKAPDAV
jgi:pyruvate-formate lyase-activating enzyme